MCTAVFREVGELKRTQKDKFALSTSSMLSLCKPVLSMPVTLAAGFYIPFSDKMLSVNPQIWGCLRRLPCSHCDSAVCVQMGLMQITSVYDPPRSESLKVLS